MSDEEFDDDFDNDEVDGSYNSVGFDESGQNSKSLDKTQTSFGEDEFDETASDKGKDGAKKDSAKDKNGSDGDDFDDDGSDDQDGFDDDDDDDSNDVKDKKTDAKPKSATSTKDQRKVQVPTRSVGPIRAKQMREKEKSRRSTRSTRSLTDTLRSTDLHMQRFYGTASTRLTSSRPPRSSHTTRPRRSGNKKLASWMTASYRSKTKFGRKAGKTSKRWETQRMQRMDLRTTYSKKRLNTLSKPKQLSERTIKKMENTKESKECTFKPTITNKWVGTSEHPEAVTTEKGILKTITRMNIGHRAALRKIRETKEEEEYTDAIGKLVCPICGKEQPHKQKKDRQNKCEKCKKQYIKAYVAFATPTYKTNCFGPVASRDKTFVKGSWSAHASAFDKRQRARIVRGNNSSKVEELIKFAEAECRVEDIDNLAHYLQDLELQSQQFQAARQKLREAGTLDENSTDPDPGLISGSTKLRAKRLLTRLMNGPRYQTAKEKALRERNPKSIEFTDRMDQDSKMRIEREKFNIMSREIAQDTTKGFKALRTRTARSYTATNAPFLERMQQDSELRHAIKRQNLTKKLYAMDSKPTPALMAPSTMHNIRDAESRRMHWTANHNVSPYDSARSQFTDMSGRVSPIETGSAMSTHSDRGDGVDQSDLAVDDLPVDPDSLDGSERGTDTESDPGGYDYGDGEEDESDDGSDGDGYEYVEGDGYDYVEGETVHEDDEDGDGVTEFSFSDQTDTTFGN